MKRRKTTASRALWILLKGPIPKGLWVLHSCHNGLECTNPDHLYVGTPLDNSKDRVELRNREKDQYPPPTDQIDYVIAPLPDLFTLAEAAKEVEVSAQRLSRILRRTSIGVYRKGYTILLDETAIAQVREIVAKKKSAAVEPAL